jgi:hypothetical protein
MQKKVVDWIRVKSHPGKFIRVTPEEGRIAPLASISIGVVDIFFFALIIEPP